MGMVFKTWHSGSGGVLLPLVAVLCLLLSLSMVIRRTKIGIGEHVAWTKLPTSVPEGTLKLKPSKVSMSPH
ncbi:hypothetical protein Tsubulata_027064 [Turnera subulata]|uniref:Uncharacterized protein n=1 Tax=Turnera subulata TaxID=218843 RepID=A0A9Q0JD37_9ROSI|nr:hypothetical protein Tsubulata_027064 [Turnera subulata]